jgi:hypothetical protein
MIAWALVSTLTCLVKDYHGMLAARLLLGVTEAPVSDQSLEDCEDITDDIFCRSSTPARYT